jgi:hypothetical protein
MHINIMPELWRITNSTRAGKRYTATLEGADRSRTVHFGSDLENFTMHKDVNRRARYFARHREREDWSNLEKPAAWARWLLWNKPTLRGSAQDMSKRFRIRIILDL